MKRYSNNGLPSKYLLSIMTIICIMLLCISYSTGFSGGPIGIVTNYLFIPIQKGIDYIGESISISSSDTKTKEQLIKENYDNKKKILDLQKLHKKYYKLKTRQNKKVLKKNTPASDAHIAAGK